MPYQKTIWKNREVEKPRTFRIQNNPDGTVTLLPAEGNIIEAGTPIIAENMNKIEDAVAAVDDTVTQHLAHYEEYIDNYNEHVDDDVAHNHYGVATGTNTLTVTLNPVPTSLTPGMTIQLKNTTTNTGNVTINANGLGAKPLLDNEGNQIGSGKLKANSMYSATYDGVNFYLTRGGGGDTSPIKSVLRGNLLIGNTELSKSITLNNVNINKSIIKYTVHRNADSAVNAGELLFLADFVNSNTVNFVRTNTRNTAVNIQYEIIEFEDNVNVLSGTLSGNETNIDAIISNIDYNKSLLQFSYNSSGNSSISGIINSSTNSLNFRKVDSNAVNIKWFVVEIK